MPHIISIYCYDNTMSEKIILRVFDDHDIELAKSNLISKQRIYAVM